jgi:hypothetical protein
MYLKIREYKRFHRSKVADTGEDPNGAMTEFIKHDIIRPLERPKNVSNRRIEIDRNKWAVGTTKQPMTLGQLPKIQPFKEYQFPRKNIEEIEKNKENYFDSDHISIRAPKIKKKDESESFLNLKNKMGPHTETYVDGWVPQGNYKTINNRSSVTYNILSNEKNDVSGAVVLKMLDVKLNNKKKGVAEFSDLTRPTHPNINRKFRENYQSNNDMFKVYNGIFSHMYDAAHRNGNIVVPFRNNNNNTVSHHTSSQNLINHDSIINSNKVRTNSSGGVNRR